MKRSDIKSSCPVNFTLEIFGDAWSLLIIRDMISVGKKTFGEFLASDERIGSSVLAERLAYLEQRGIITKKLDSKDKRKMVYSLTKAGLDIIPVMYEISVWGTLNSPQPNASPEWFASLKYDKDVVVKAYRDAVAAGSSFSNGPHSVKNKLNLE